MAWDLSIKLSISSPGSFRIGPPPALLRPVWPPHSSRMMPWVVPWIRSTRMESPKSAASLPRRPPSGRACVQALSTYSESSRLEATEGQERASFGPTWLLRNHLGTCDFTPHLESFLHLLTVCESGQAMPA